MGFSKIQEEFKQKLIIKKQEKEISDLKRSELEIQKIQLQQVKDRKDVLEMFSEMYSDPEKFKIVLKEFREEDKD